VEPDMNLEDTLRKEAREHADQVLAAMAMARDPELAALMAQIAEDRARAVALVLDHISKRGRAYSRELRDLPTMETPLHRIALLLRELEIEGVLVSELVAPPHEGRRGGGMQRRYYRLAKTAESRS
jgi:hypothetical protein